MQFRIRTLMILVALAAFLLAVWHFLPLGRTGLLYYGLAAVLIGPPTFLAKSRPGARSIRWKVGFSAYCLLMVAIYAACVGWLIVHDPKLPERMATWPG